MKIDRQKFMTEWNQCESLDQFCKATGLDRRDASNLAAHLRTRCGMNLKHMPRRRGRVILSRATANLAPNPLTGKLCIALIAGCYSVVAVGAGLQRQILRSFEGEKQAEDFARTLTQTA